jgi:hypothetical protein
VKLRFVFAAGGVLAIFVVASHVGLWVVAAMAAPVALVVHQRASRGLRFAVEAKSRALRELTFDDLAAIEDPSDGHAEYPVIGPRVAEVEVLVNHSAADTLRVVVRGSMDVLFYTLVRFDGFYARRGAEAWPMKGAEFDALDGLRSFADQLSTDGAMSEPHAAASDRDGLLRRALEVLGSAEYRRVEKPIAHGAAHSVCYLQAPEGADYAFRVWIYDDGEPEICARLRGAPEDGFFWGRHFELPAYTSVESRNSSFLEILERVVTCRTRITQSKGLLFWDFHCEALVGNTWISVGGHSAARWIHGIRDTGRNTTVYFSPTVRKGERAVAEE